MVVTLTIQKTIRLHSVQAAFRNSQALYRGFVGGIGSGKSWIGAYDLIRRARRGRLYLAAAPTYTMLEDATIRTFLKIGYDLGVILPDTLRKQPPSVQLSTGAEILFRSGDNADRLRATNLSGVWLDEASLMPREVYDVVIGRLRQEGEQGWMSATFTPKGLGHWTYEVFGKVQPNTELFHARTKDNPFGPVGFADRLQEQYAGVLAAQELDGRFVNTEGAEWPPGYFEGILFDSWPDNLVVKVLALDPSKGKDGRHGDYSALVSVGLDQAGCLWVDADLARRPTPQIVEDGIRIFRQWRPQAIVVEVNQFQEMLAAEFARTGKQKGFALPMWGIDNRANKAVRIRTLGPYLARQELRIKDTPGGQLLLAQLRDFPVAEHDDGPDALEMGVRMVRYLLGDRPAHGEPELVEGDRRVV